VGVTSSKFQLKLRRQNPRVPGVLYGFVCVDGILTECRLVTDGKADSHRPEHASSIRWKLEYAYLTHGANALIILYRISLAYSCIGYAILFSLHVGRTTE